MVKRFLVLLIILAGLILVYTNLPRSSVPPPHLQPSVQQKAIQTDTPQLISTKPDPLDEAIIIPTQTVEIAFNLPIENIGEFKYELTPKANYKSKLSDDRKTVILMPDPTWPVGTTFTLNISPLTKFDGGKRLKEGKIIHFKTIDYKGV